MGRVSSIRDAYEIAFLLGIWSRLADAAWVGLPARLQLERLRLWSSVCLLIIHKLATVQLRGRVQVAVS